MATDRASTSTQKTISYNNSPVSINSVNAKILSTSSLHVEVIVSDPSKMENYGIEAIENGHSQKWTSISPVVVFEKGIDLSQTTINFELLDKHGRKISLSKNFCLSSLTPAQVIAQNLKGDEYHKALGMLYFDSCLSVQSNFTLLMNELKNSANSFYFKGSISRLLTNTAFQANSSEVFDEVVKQLKQAPTGYQRSDFTLALGELKGLGDKVALYLKDMIFLNGDFTSESISSIPTMQVLKALETQSTLKSKEILQEISVTKNSNIQVEKQQSIYLLQKMSAATTPTLYQLPMDHVLYGKTNGRFFNAKFDGNLYTLYIPTFKPGKPIRLLVSVHGTLGDAFWYATKPVGDNFEKRPADKVIATHGVFSSSFNYADNYNLIVISPQFDGPNFPNYDTMNVGFRMIRSDLWMLKLVDYIGNYLKTSENISVDYNNFLLFGHSKGGQFVNRFATYHPERIAAAVAGSSGSYIYPSEIRINPYALDLNVSFLNIIKAPLRIITGTKDAAESTNLCRRRKGFEAFRDFIDSTIEINQMSPKDVKISFLWAENGTHTDSSDVLPAMEYLLSDRPDVPGVDYQTSDDPLCKDSY